MIHPAPYVPCTRRVYTIVKRNSKLQDGHLQAHLLQFSCKSRNNSIYLFKQAGVEFEDVRVEQAQWQELKPTTPYGSMPVLEEDGKQLAGSKTIQRYLAEKFGLAGSNAWENAQLDSIIDVGTDMLNKVFDLLFEKEEARKEMLKKNLEEEILPNFFGIFENLMKNTPNGWVFGSEVTYADLAIYNMMDWVKMVDKEIFKKYPALEKNLAAVEALPNIAKWLKERPATQY